MRAVITTLLALVLVAAGEGWAGEQEFRAFDGFDGKLALKWQPVAPDPSHVSLTKHPGKLTITTQLGGMFADARRDPLLKGVELRNLYLLPNPAPAGGDFVATTCIESFLPKAVYQQAGLLLYNDEDNYLKLTLEYNRRTRSGVAYTCVSERNQRAAIRYVEAKPDLKKFWLRITMRGKDCQCAFSIDGETYEGVCETVWDAGRPKSIGLVAKNGGQPEAGDVDASFDFFEVRSLTAAEKSDPRYVDKRKLQGTWQVVSSRFGGEPLKDAHFSQFAFSDDRLVILDDPDTLVTNYKLHAGNPKRIVLSGYSSRARASGRSVNAVYSLEADTLVICFDPRPGSPAPTELETKQGDGRMLVTLNRAKPVP